MDHSSITLATVMALREEERPVASSDPRKVVPYKVLRNLISSFDVDSAVFYLASPRGRGPTKILLVGDRVPGVGFDQDTAWNEDCIRRKKLVLEVSPIARSKKRRSPRLGHLVAYRREPFEAADVRILEHLCEFIGEFMFKDMESAATLRCNKALGRIKALRSESLQPGSLICRAQGFLHRATNAVASYFATCEGGTLHLEYYSRRPRRNPWAREGTIEVQPSGSFLELLSQKKSFMWHDDDQSFTAKVASSRIDNWNERWLYLVAPFHHEAGAIGCWFLQFPEERTLFPSTYMDLIKTAAELIGPEVIYLFQRKSSNMIVNPIFHNRETRVKEDQIFVLMPFGEAWSDRIWKRLIRSIIADKGFVARRADDLYGRDIMEDVWSSIVRSRIIVADITGRNPNVFYELGIAHAIGKDVILLTQEKDDIPFDLNRYRHIVYEDNLDGYEILKKELEASIEELLKV